MKYDPRSMAVEQCLKILGNPRTASQENFAEELTTIGLAEFASRLNANQIRVLLNAHQQLNHPNQWMEALSDYCLEREKQQLRQLRMESMRQEANPLKELKRFRSEHPQTHSVL